MQIGEQDNGHLRTRPETGRQRPCPARSPFFPVPPLTDQLSRPVRTVTQPGPRSSDTEPVVVSPLPSVKEVQEVLCTGSSRVGLGGRVTPHSRTCPCTESKSHRILLPTYRRIPLLSSGLQSYFQVLRDIKSRLTLKSKRHEVKGVVTSPNTSPNSLTCTRTLQIASFGVSSVHSSSTITILYKGRCGPQPKS